MAKLNIDVIIIVAYLIITLIIGVISGRSIKNLKEYAVGSKNFSSIIIFSTVLATWVGGNTTFSGAATSFDNALYDALGTLSAALCILIIAYAISPRMKPFKNCVSVAEAMEQMYGSYAGLLTGILSVAICMGFIGCQIKAMTFMFDYFFEIDSKLATILSMSLLTIYSSVGGIRAVTFTDFVQFITLAVTVPLICNLGVELMGGYTKLYHSIPEGHLSINIHSYKFKRFIWTFVAMAVPTLNPAIFQRMLMAKNKAQIKTAFKMTCIAFIFFKFFVLVIGLVALQLDPNILPNHAFLYVIDNYFPPGFKSFTLCGVLAIIMSSGDSFMNAAGITIINDLIAPYCPKPLSEKAKLRISRASTLLVGLSSTWLALQYDSLFDLVMLTLGTWQPFIAPPLLMGIFGFRTSAKIFLMSLSASAIVMSLWQFYNLEALTTVPAMIIGMCINSICLLIAEHLRRNYYFLKTLLG